MKAKFECPIPFGHYNIDTGEWINSQCGRWECVVCGRKNWKYVSDIILDGFGSECRKMTLSKVTGQKNILKGWHNFQRNLYNNGMKMTYFIWIRTYDRYLTETLHVFTNAMIEKEAKVLEFLWSKAICDGEDIRDIFGANPEYIFDIKVLRPVNEELIRINDLVVQTIDVKKEFGFKDGGKVYGLSLPLSKLRNESDAIELKKLKSITKVIKCEHESATHPDHKGKEEFVCWDIDTEKCYTKAHRPLTIKDILDAQLEKDGYIEDI